MEKEEIIRKINAFIVEDFEVEEHLIKPEADIVETLEIDSLDLIDLVVLIERNFGFKVKNEELMKIKTIQNLYDYIYENANK